MRKLTDRERFILLVVAFAVATGVGRMASRRGSGPDVLPLELTLLFGGLLMVALAAWAWKHNWFGGYDD
ncbi:hypothetical protein [Phenylobacterium sp.]|uniref:hypothetical protein n=1 Tax=Phenylobacterium sp. TaxID=1871053 RepID=UPI002615D8AB|nr:hypothetical protein [Phenylobacterium sp.]